MIVSILFQTDCLLMHDSKYISRLGTVVLLDFSCNLLSQATVLEEISYYYSCERHEISGCNTFQPLRLLSSLAMLEWVP